MTVNTTSITSGPYPGNDIADEFSYGFTIQDKTELEVYETDDLGVEELLTVDTDYTVAGIGDAGGGEVTRVAGALPTDYSWFIRSAYPQTQLTDFDSQGGFFPDVHEDAFDKLTFLVQQMLDADSRSPAVSNSYTGTLPISMEDPAAGRALRWNAAGDGLVNYDPEAPIALSGATYNYLLNGALNSNDISLGDVVRILDRMDGLFTVVLTVSVTPDGYGIVQCIEQPSLSLSLRFGSIFFVEQFGAVADYDYETNTGTDDSGPIQAAIEAARNRGIVSLKAGFSLLETGLVLQRADYIMGLGTCNNNGYRSDFSETDIVGGSGLVVPAGITAFSFNKGAYNVAFGCKIKSMSIYGELVSQSAFSDPPKYTATANGINASDTAELECDFVDFHGIDKCFSNDGTGSAAVKPLISNITSKEVNEVFPLKDSAGDWTLTTGSCIKQNYFIHTDGVDGVTLSNFTVYRSYISAVKNTNTTPGDPTNFFHASNCKFFESGGLLIDMERLSQVTFSGCDFVRAGLVTDTVQTAVKIDDVEVCSITGGQVERPLGDGMELTNIRSLNVDMAVLEYGWQKGNRKGIIATNNRVANLKGSILGAGNESLAGYDVENNLFLNGSITTDDIGRGQTEFLPINAEVVETYDTGGSGQVIADEGSLPIAVDVPYTLEPGQRCLIYDIEFAEGGTGVGMTGLVFRVNSDFTTTLADPSPIELRKNVETSLTTDPPKDDVFTVYLYNDTGATFTIPANLEIKFKWKVVQYRMPAY